MSIFRRVKSSIHRALTQRRRRRLLHCERQRVRNASRRLSSEQLENRQLLAADLGGMQHNHFDPEDVNDDGEVAPNDALMLINALNRPDASVDPLLFMDVDNDGFRSPSDVLRIVNRLNRRGDSSESRPGPDAGGTLGDGQPGANDQRDPVGDQRGRGDSQSRVDPSTVGQVRSIDGTGNNLENPLLGSAGQTLLRIAEPGYADGISEPAGADRPSTREVSNLLAETDSGSEWSERGLSAFVYVWGQFIDHDIDLTHAQEDGESLAIEVPTGDPQFDPFSTGEASIPFTRSEFDPDTGTSVENPREQINSITAFIDGSMVYGSDSATADSLRLFSGGELLISDDGLLPTDDDGNLLAGDVRAAENPSLTAMHVLFVREHNRLAAEIAERDPSLDDEAIYQEARASVVAQIQAITYNEFLPALLGNRALGSYTGYDSTVDPTVANEFSTAAFRFGHSTLNDEIGFMGNDGTEVRDSMGLFETFFNPAVLEETGIDSVLKFNASIQSQEVDLHVVDSLRNALFGPPGSGGLDLVALNIQRGRDHGLADYNSTRVAYGLEPVDGFEDITSDSQLQADLESLYGDVNNIDLWVGLMAEDHVRGASVGELTSLIISDQFQRLRSGDRFWYENTFEGRELRDLQSTSLSDVLERNTGLEGLQSDVFFMHAGVSGRVLGAATVAPAGELTRGTQPADRNEQRSGRTSGNELADMAVRLVDGEGTVLETTTTDSQGRYRFGSLPVT
ncbi:MAG TPA: peroxidase, partial [Planctomycetaceae bacterium]|nr:peroxidase [Planctomycetaceae bacterium]